MALKQMSPMHSVSFQAFSAQWRIDIGFVRHLNDTFLCDLSIGVSLVCVCGKN